MDMDEKFKRDGKIDIEWITGAHAPDIVLSIMSCKCV
jgi:hypothetical protein